MAKELTESRRTRYTRKAMQGDALIDLMRERPLGSITIKALCEQADVNRSTFYSRALRQHRGAATRHRGRNNGMGHDRARPAAHAA